LQNSTQPIPDFVELSLDDRDVDLAAEGVDIAIRAGALADSANLIARRLFVAGKPVQRLSTWSALDDRNIQMN